MIKSICPDTDRHPSSAPEPARQGVRLPHPRTGRRYVRRPPPGRVAAAVVGHGRRTPRPLGVPGNWSLKFDANSLNTRLWSKGWLAPGITPPVSSKEQDCYDPQSGSVAHGVLSLTVIPKHEKCGRAGTQPYASGLINAAGKYCFPYGHAGTDLESRQRRRSAGYDSHHVLHQPAESVFAMVSVSLDGAGPRGRNP
jgi:hypothetical protein